MWRGGRGGVGDRLDPPDDVCFLERSQDDVRSGVGEREGWAERDRENGGDDALDGEQVVGLDRDVRLDAGRGEGAADDRVGAAAVPRTQGSLASSRNEIVLRLASRWRRGRMATIGSSIR